MVSMNCKVLCGSVPLFAGTDQRVVGDHVWQEALVQHCPEEFKGSLRQRV